MAKKKKNRRKKRNKKLFSVRTALNHVKKNNIFSIPRCRPLPIRVLYVHSNSQEYIMVNCTYQIRIIYIKCTHLHRTG